MDASSIYNDDLKKYTISRLSSLSKNIEGIQTQNRTSHDVDLSVYDKGTKLVNKTGEDTYKLATIMIYSDLNILELLDEIPFNGLNYTVTENQNDVDYSVYKAVANV